MVGLLLLVLSLRDPGFCHFGVSSNGGIEDWIFVASGFLHRVNVAPACFEFCALAIIGYNRERLEYSFCRNFVNLFYSIDPVYVVRVGI